jgi:ribosomal protein S18 acetylase RimI-like enzyme
MGFRVIGRRAAYYRRGEGPAADALIMRLTLN